MMWPFKWNIFSSTFTRSYLQFELFTSMGEILWHAVLCFCTINFIILNLALLTYEAGGKSCAVPFNWNLENSNFTWHDFICFNFFFKVKLKCFDHFQRLIIYTKKLAKKGVQFSCNASTNYKWFLIGWKHNRNQQEPMRLELC